MMRRMRKCGFLWPFWMLLVLYQLCCDDGVVVAMRTTTTTALSTRSHIFNSAPIVQRSLFSISQQQYQSPREADAPLRQQQPLLNNNNNEKDWLERQQQKSVAYYRHGSSSSSSSNRNTTTASYYYTSNSNQVDPMRSQPGTENRGTGGSPSSSSSSTTTNNASGRGSSAATKLRSPYKNRRVSYYSRLSDVWLCLLMALGWMLWMLSSFTKSDLLKYQKDSVVIRGHVLQVSVEEDSLGTGIPTYKAVIDYMVQHEESQFQIRKHFETQKLLEEGFANVELLVLPQEPTHSVLREDWEMQVEEQQQEDVYGVMRNYLCRRISLLFAGILVLASLAGCIHVVVRMDPDERWKGWASVCSGIPLLMPAALACLRLIHAFQRSLEYQSEKGGIVIRGADELMSRQQSATRTTLVEDACQPCPFDDPDVLDVRACDDGEFHCNMVNGDTAVDRTPTKVNTDNNMHKRHPYQRGGHNPDDDDNKGGGGGDDDDSDLSGCYFVRFPVRRSKQGDGKIPDGRGNLNPSHVLTPQKKQSEMHLVDGPVHTFKGRHHRHRDRQQQEDQLSIQDRSSSASTVSSISIHEQSFGLRGSGNLMTDDDIETYLQRIDSSHSVSYPPPPPPLQGTAATTTAVATKPPPTLPATTTTPTPVIISHSSASYGLFGCGPQW